jgi:hypothetical protein
MNPPVLDTGYHIVNINKIFSGKSEQKNVPFHGVSFINGSGYFNERFYVNEMGRMRLSIFLRTFDMDGRLLTPDYIVYALNKVNGSILSLKIELNPGGYKESLAWQKVFNGSQLLNTRGLYPNR